jgi:uncharacterized protein YbjT (DUF2867 family)
MSERTVVVFGASGNVGAVLARKLAERGVLVRAFYDRSTPQRAAFPDGVVELHGTFEDDVAIRRATAGADAVFLLTPPSRDQVGWQRTIVDAAVAGQVQRVVKLSAFETAPDSPLQMGRWHYDGERALAQSGLDYVILRPQYFMQNLTGALREATRTGVLRGAATGDTRLGVVDVQDVAGVAAVVLTEPGHEREVLLPTGPAALSFDDMAAELSVVAGAPVRYEQRAPQRITTELVARGWPDWHISDFFKIHGEAASPTVTSVVEDITGFPAGDFSSFLGREITQPATA